jgi:hypothetical protein
MQRAKRNVGSGIRITRTFESPANRLLLQRILNGPGRVLRLSATGLTG